MKMAYVILGGIILMVILLVAAYSYGRYHPREDVIGVLTEQIRAETARQYEGRISELNAKLLASQKAYAESQGKYDAIIKKLKEIRDEKNKVQPPETMDELTSRFNSLGYPPSSPCK